MSLARNFQEWFNSCRPPFLLKTEGSAMIPKKNIIASLNDAFEAGRAAGLAAGRIEARQEAVAVSRTEGSNDGLDSCSVGVSVDWISAVSGE